MRSTSFRSQVRRGPAAILFAATAIVPALATAQEPSLHGGEIPVNSYASGVQRSSAVAMDGSGRFVVVWMSDGSNGGDASSYSILGQRFDAEGSPLGSELQINSYTTSYQENPSVAVDGAGNFVVAWDSGGSAESDGSGTSIQARRFDADGNAIGEDFQVNSSTAGAQYSPSVAMNAAGSFVVVWESESSLGDDASSYSVQGQLYDADGNTVGGEFQVNTYPTGSQTVAQAAMDADGNFVVVWQSGGSDSTTPPADTDSTSIHGQRFDSGGSPLGAEFQVNLFTTGSQILPAIAIADGGQFVVVWQSSGSGASDQDGTSIQGRRYAPSGMPFTPELQVNTYTTDNQNSPAVAMDAAGDFVVTWFSLGSDGGDDDLQSVQAQRISDSGGPIGDQFQVNTYTTRGQSSSAVAMSPTGDFVITWDSEGSVGTDQSNAIEAQLFDALFRDSFEIDGMGRWTLPAD